MVGVMEQTGVFEARQPRDVVFGADPKLLYINATEIRRITLANVARSKVDKVSEAVYNQTHGGLEEETSK